ncbi:hypothetical protein F53441_7687 [Fusarium austroafricanum]|uniref:AAA+ ATPase domain-containing protein n=1 Tax=Fusarium austroafricanum TaxID=2364996 RepID=A0A8H4KEP4_9HYPO|nr:hypothetical protein F53441_7687 [Fusarium austroafricanum]
MSFGCGVGDIIKVVELVQQARRRFVNAPAQYHEVANEVKHVSSVIQYVDVLMSEGGLNAEQRAILENIKSDSISLLNDRMKRLDNYKELGTSSTRPTHNLKKAWKKFNWDPDDAKDFRRKISRHVESLNVIDRQISRQTLSKIQQDVHQLTHEVNERKREDILNWIGDIDYGSRQSDAFDKRVDGTCEWFLQSDKFQQWVNTNGEVLFCPGLPGAGKTVMTSVVIRHLLDQFENDSNIGIGYHYCEYTRQETESNRDILSSILTQLARRRDSVPEALSKLYAKYKPQKTSPPLKEIISALILVASLFPRVFLVVDGLDECVEFSELLAHLRDLRGANILVTSRSIPKIVKDKSLEGSNALEICASEADVGRYLDRNMPKLNVYDKCDDQILEGLRKVILESMGGMFLLVQLYHKLLADTSSLKLLKSAIATLPTGSFAYDKMYADSMERIEKQTSVRKDLAKRVLTWLTFSRRPLKVPELQAAASIEETDSDLDDESLVDIVSLVSICAGLVLVEDSSQTIKLIHYTAQEYLERTREGWNHDANASMTTPCLTYLLFPDFDVEFIDFEEYMKVGSQKRALYPFLDYCIQYGALHARIALPGTPSVARFFSSKSRVTRNWLLLAAKDRSPQAQATVEWLAEHGACKLLKRGAALTPDSNNMTPFHYVVRNNTQKVAQIFIDAGIPVDLPVTREVHKPAFQGNRVMYPEPAGVLHTDQKRSTKEGLTALHFSALTGSLQMTRFLLDQGADPNFLSIHHETPLHLALKETLYDSKFRDSWTDPDDRIECTLEYVKDEEYGSSRAFINETRSAIINLLLEHPRIDVNVQDIYGVSPLHIAARHKLSESLIGKLMGKGAKISTRTTNGKTPLHFACQKGHLASVKIFLNSGADPEDRDADGVNALHYAAQYGDAELIKDVLNHVPGNHLESFVKSTDKQGRNALHHLLRLKSFSDTRTDALKCLLDAPVSAGARDRTGMSPMAVYLSECVLMGGHNDSEILHLLFQYGADAAFSTRDGLNLAHLAASSRRVSTKLLQTLAQADVDMGARDKQGRTAIHHGAISGNLTKEALVCLQDEFLLSPRLVDASGKAALDYAFERKQEEHRPSLFDRDRWARVERLLQDEFV